MNGLPVFAHGKDDLNAFRYITSNFTDQKLCRKVDVERCFDVSSYTVSRSYKKFVDRVE